MMCVPEFYEAVFKWPHPDAHDVIVTGEFDAWSCSIHLPRSTAGFEGVIKVPWGRKVAYKYIVDGRWTCTDDQPTELDSIGNLNNVFTSPARPSTPNVVAPLPTPTQPAGQVNGFLATAKDAAVAMIEALAPGTAVTPTETPITTEPPKLEVKEQVEEKVVEPVQAAVNGVAHATDDIASKAVNPENKEETPETSAPEPVSVSTPPQELSAESILPSAAAATKPTAPFVPVPLLPLTSTKESDEIPLETTVVSGAVTNGLAEPAQEVSTHTPILPLNQKSTPNGNGTASPAAEEAPKTTEEAAKPAEEESQLAEEPKPLEELPTIPENPTDETTKAALPASIPLPPATPGEVPLPVTPSTPKTNGKAPSPTQSPPNSPQSTPHKEKRRTFTLGRSHRKSSSTISADEFGSASNTSTMSRSESTKKRKGSFIKKIKEFFADHEKQEVKK